MDDYGFTPSINIRTNLSVFSECCKEYYLKIGCDEI